MIVLCTEYSYKKNTQIEVGRNINILRFVYFYFFFSFQLHEICFSTLWEGKGKEGLGGVRKGNEGLGGVRKGK